MELHRRLLMVFIVLANVLFLSSLSYGQDKALVAIMDFENKAQYSGWRIGEGAADMLATEVVKAKTFRVIERDKLAAILKEQNFSNSDRVDPSTATRIGKILGVQYIITGAVTEYGQSRSGGGGRGVNVGKVGYFSAVDIRVLDATTGEILFADSGEGEKSSVNVKVFGIGGGEKFNEKHATEAMRDAIASLTDKLKNADFSAGVAPKPSGPTLVADVDGKNIMLNQGSGAGFKAGQTVEISREDKVIKDPSTGAVLTVRYKTVGKIKLTNVESSFSEGTVVSGSGFVVGDVVQ